MMLSALLPENFKPAPRETKADEDGTINTLDRRLKDRVYLMIGDCFPTTDLKISKNEDDRYDNDCETLLEAAHRGLKELNIRGEGKKKGELPIDLYSPSQEFFRILFSSMSLQIRLQILELCFEWCFVGHDDW